MSEPIKEPNLPECLASDDPQSRLLAVGEVLWQAQSFARTVAMAQKQLSHLLPGEHMSEDAKKACASVMRVAENLTVWLDQHCAAVYAEATKNTPQSAEPLSVTRH